MLADGVQHEIGYQAPKVNSPLFVADGASASRGAFVAAALLILAASLTSKGAELSPETLTAWGRLCAGSKRSSRWLLQWATNPTDLGLLPQRFEHPQHGQRIDEARCSLTGAQGAGA